MALFGLNVPTIVFWRTPTLAHLGWFVVMAGGRGAVAHYSADPGHRARRLHRPHSPSSSCSSDMGGPPRVRILRRGAPPITCSSADAVIARRDELDGPATWREARRPPLNGSAFRHLISNITDVAVEAKERDQCIKDLRCPGASRRSENEFAVPRFRFVTWRRERRVSVVRRRVVGVTTRCDPGAGRSGCGSLVSARRRAEERRSR